MIWTIFDANDEATWPPLDLDVLCYYGPNLGMEVRRRNLGENGLDSLGPVLKWRLLPNPDDDVVEVPREALEQIEGIAANIVNCEIDSQVTDDCAQICQILKGAKECQK